MGYGRLSDAVVPDIFSPYEHKNTMENFKLFKSGVLTTDDLIAKQLQGGGRLFQTPSWLDLPDEEENVGSDDDSTSSTPSKIGSMEEQSIRHNVNNSWAAMRLQRELAGSDSMKRIAARVSNYWNLRFNARFVAIVNGIIADNIANDGGDMVIDNSTQGTITVANKVSAEGAIETRQTLGDAGEGMLMMVHSRMAADMERNNLIAYIRDSEGKPVGATYREHDLIISDKCNIDTTGINPVYSVYLMGKGSFGWSEKSLPNGEATEVDKKPELGNGQGGDILYSRKQFVMHPYGFSWTDASCAGSSPTLAENENAANWNRVVPERKQVAIAVLKVNG